MDLNRHSFDVDGLAYGVGVGKSSQGGNVHLCTLGGADWQMLARAVYPASLSTPKRGEIEPEREIEVGRTGSALSAQDEGRC